MGRPPLNTAIPGELVKIHLIGEQIQNISDFQSADIISMVCVLSWKYQHFFLGGGEIW